MKKIYLTNEHVMQVINKNLLVGSDTAQNGSRKMMFFNPFAQEFLILCNHTEHLRTKDQDAALQTYNEM